MTLTIDVLASHCLFRGLHVETVVLCNYTVYTIEHAQFLICVFVGLIDIYIGFGVFDVLHSVS